MLKFLKSLSLGDIAIALLAVAFVASYIQLQITHGKLSAEREKTARLEMQVATAGQLLAQQNAGIEALSAQREEDRKAYLAGIRAADKQAVRLEIDAADILSLPSPATRDEQCTAAETLLRSELTQ